MVVAIFGFCAHSILVALCLATVLLKLLSLFVALFPCLVGLTVKSLFNVLNALKGNSHSHREKMEVEMKS